MTAIRGSGGEVPVLAYHEVSAVTERRKRTRKMGADCSILHERFGAQLAFLKQRAFETPTRFDSLSLQNTAGERRKRAVITFDDGHAGNYEFAFPLLLEHGFSGIFFITTDLVGQTGMMTWDNVKEMVRHGMAIQSHCVSHAPLETLSEEKMSEELRVSKLLIEEATQAEVHLLSLPHGSHHPRLRDAARITGYTYVCTSSVDYYHPSEALPPIFVPRIPIPDTLAMPSFLEVIEGSGAIVRKWQVRQAVKSVIKRILGINNYRKIYRLVNKIDV